MHVRHSSGVRLADPFSVHFEVVNHEIASLEIEDQTHSFSKFDISSRAVK